jgi:hypothetical protein
MAGRRLFLTRLFLVQLLVGRTLTAARTYSFAFAHAKSSPPCSAEAGVPGGARALAESWEYHPQFCGQT